MPRRSLPAALALSGLLVLASGCEREPPAPPADGDHHPVVTVDLQLAVVFLYGAHEYEIASVYEENGTLFKLDKLRFILSNTRIFDDHQVQLGEFPGQALVVDAGLGMNTFDLGQLTASHAHDMHWTLGLDAAMNHVDPAAVQPPLDDASLRCGPAAADGFRFLEVEGRWDSNGNGDIDAADATFAYHACGDALARPARSRIHGDLPTDGQPMLVPVRVDVAQLLQGVDLTAAATADAALNELLLSNLVTSLATEH